MGSPGDRQLSHVRALLGVMEALEAGDAAPARQALTILRSRLSPESIDTDVAIGLLRRALGELTGPSVTPKDTSHPFYQPPQTCQIPALGMWYEKFFGLRRDGYFVEAGSFDGESYSNTSCLADLGWQGLYIEPVAEYAALCRRRHAENPDIFIIESALTARPQEITLHLAGAATTAESAALDAAGADPLLAPLVSSETRSIPGLPLDDLLSDLAVPTGFELLVLDVEGHEWEALQGFTPAHWRPQVILLETSDRHPGHAQHGTLAEDSRRCRALLDPLYQEIWGDAANSLYIRRDLPL